MTCKDCKKCNNCKDPDKSFKYDEDGDSWANWCDDFDTIHADKTIHNGGLVVTQCGYNFHIWVADEKTGKALAHFGCEEEKNEKELAKFADFVKNKLLEFVDKLLEDEEDDEWPKESD